VKRAWLCVGSAASKCVRFARLAQASQAGGALLQRNLIINLTLRDRRAGLLERRTAFKRACAAGVREAGARLYAEERAAFMGRRAA